SGAKTAVRSANLVDAPGGALSQTLSGFARQPFVHGFVQTAGISCGSRPRSGAGFWFRCGNSLQRSPVSARSPGNGFGIQRQRTTVGLEIECAEYFAAPRY